MANDEKRTVILNLTKKYVTAGPKMWPSTVKDPENWIVNRQNRKEIKRQPSKLPSSPPIEILI